MTSTSRARAHRSRCLLAVLAVAGAATATLTLAPAAAGGQAQTSAAQSVTVPIRSFMFMPSDLMVNTGDTVTWVNEDRAPHDVTTTGGPAQFASGPLTQGKSFSHTFSVPGSYPYQCTIHPDMVATVMAMDDEPVAAAPAPVEEAPAPDEGAAADDAPAESVPAEDAPAGGVAEEGAVGAVPSVDASATAIAVPTPSLSPVPVNAAPAPATTQAVGATQGRQFDPLLIVAGVALGVATLCLLLVTSRAPRRG